MSLVGTRPPTVDEWDKYELHHRARLATKPGLTAMGRLLLRERIKYLYLRSQRQCLGRYPVVCRSWRKSTLRNMFLFLFHYLEKVSSLSCGPVEIYDRSRYQQWRYDCDPEAIEKKMGKQR